MMSETGYKLLAQAAGEPVHTAIGTFSSNFSEFVGEIATIGIAVGGVAAIGLLTAGAFTILTSTGEPEKLLNGREMITNALMGLALIILSLFVLEFLGWDVLRIGDITGVPFNQWN
jgi:hypothetical protein